MRRTFILLIGSVLVALALAACGDETRGGGGGGPMPICPPENLEIPVLVTPDDGTNVEIPGLTFHWVYNPAGCLPEEFEIQVSQSHSFDNLSGATLDVGESHWSPQVGLLSATIYYWRMRATVTDGPGPWSPTWSFYTGPVCEAASLVAPEPIFPAGYMFVYDAPFFEWTYPDDACVAEGYHLQVASDPGFATLVFDERRTDPSTLWLPTFDLENCSVYYWHVAAIQGGSDGPYSATETFSVNVAATCTQQCTEDQLVAPVPLGPPHYANVGTAPTEGLVPGLLWWGYPMPCLPEGFGVHLSTERDFSDSSLFGGVHPVTGFGGNWTPSVPLEPATQYWWEVFAGIGTTFGPTSPVRSFFTGPQCASGSDAIPPTLLSPEDGATVDTLTPWLRYTPGEGGCVPDGYAIYLDTDADFAGEEPYASLNLPGTTFIPDPLQDCTTYYWRVSPIQDDFILPWSEVWSFRTDANPNTVCAQGQPLGRAIRDLACRFGPGPGWEIRWYWLQGEETPVYARDMSGNWLAVQNQDDPDRICWVPRDGVEFPGSVENLRIFDAPTVCSRDLPQAECQAAGGTWVQPVGAVAQLPPYCQCP